MNTASSGSFYYQDRKGSRVLSWIVLALSAGALFLVRALVGNALLSIAGFFAALVVLGILTIPLNNRLFLHQGEYELSQNQLTLRLPKETVSLTRSQISGAVSEAVYDRRVRGSGSVLCWRVRITAKEKTYEFCSETVNNSSEELTNRVETLTDFGRDLRRWYKED